MQYICTEDRPSMIDKCSILLPFMHILVSHSSLFVQHCVLDLVSGSDIGKDGIKEEYFPQTREGFVKTNNETNILRYRHIITFTDCRCGFLILNIFSIYQPHFAEASELYLQIADKCSQQSLYIENSGKLWGKFQRGEELSNFKQIYTFSLTNRNTTR